LACFGERERLLMLKVTGLIVRARMALRWNQRELGENLGWSYRTATRWESGGAHLDPKGVTTLATLVHAVDPALAAELAATIGQTLVGLGIESPPAPPAVAPVVAPPPPPPAPLLPHAPPVLPTAPGDLVDAIVCSVADAANVAPRVVRPMVLLALRRALEVRLDLTAANEAKVLEDAAPAVTQAAKDTLHPLESLGGGRASSRPSEA
jgi:hypothetical protein